jgi:outer membrane biosynthesis protein TonB
MQTTSPEANSSSLDTPNAFARGRGGHRVALAVVLALHAVLLTLALLSRWHTPPPPQHERSTDVVVDLPPEKKIVEPPPEPPMPPELPAPVPPPPPTMTPVVPELPKLEFKPDAIVAPPPAPAPPVPAVVTAPAEGAKDTKAGPAGGTTGTGAAAGTGTGTASTKLFAECADTPDRRMVADVYRLRRDTQTVKAMDKRKPIKRVCMAQLDVEPRNFNEGFPGLDMTEWFGLDIRFTITIAKTGNWDIMILSDDGSRVSIDDKEIINNDGIHAPNAVMETVTLTQGVHNVRVRYYQGPGQGLALMLGWKKEGAKDWVLIPQSVIGRPPAELLPPLPAPES